MNSIINKNISCQFNKNQDKEICPEASKNHYNENGKVIADDAKETISKKILKIGSRDSQVRI